jgi:hypothetical protein
MTYSFRPAASFTDRKGCFVALTGTTNSGKTYSALELATGLAGDKRIAVADTEGGRTLHLKKYFDFDALIMSPPFRPENFSRVAEDAEQQGFGCLLIDSYSQEWAGIGGVLDWQESDLEEMVKRALARRDENRPDWKIREAMKMASWIKPKSRHKASVLSFLTRRIPIIFSIRGEESVKPAENGGKPIKIYKSICDKMFPFELTVAFRLAQDRKGYIDLSDPTSWKMEGDHQAIFRDGDRITREHGAKLAAWARGETANGQCNLAPTSSKQMTDEDYANDVIAKLEASTSVQELDAVVAANPKIGHCSKQIIDMVQTVYLGVKHGLQRGAA